MHNSPLALRLALASLVALFGCSGPSLAELAVGQPAPAFTLSDLDGHEVSLAAFRGKTVVLEWINPNCPISRGHAERHTMIDTAARHPEAVWLAINSTNPNHPDHVDRATHKSYDARHGITYPVLEDPNGEVGRAFGAKTTPHMFVIDATGVVAYAGAIDDGERGGGKPNFVDSALTALAAGRRPDPAATRPYGCSVKY